MASEYIKIVTESDFEYEVIAYSSQTPVIVDFWAEWCRPCKTLTPILERITEEARGSFRLAKLNVDDNPNIALRYNVRSIPNVKTFQDGRVVSELIGLQPEARIKEFIRNIAPSQIDLLLEKGQSLIETLNWLEASNAYQQFLTKSINNPAGLLGLLKSSLMLGNYLEARKIMNEFPPSPEYARMQVIKPLYDAIIDINSHQDIPDDPLEAAYHSAMWLIIRGNLPAAMDGLIDILRQDKHFHNDEVRKVILGLFEILGDTSLMQEYRQELALVLF